MFRSGFLVVTSPLSLVQCRIPAILTSAANYVHEILYVHLAPDLVSSHVQDRNKGNAALPLPQKRLCPTDDVKKLISGVYSSAVAHSSQLDVRVVLSNITGTDIKSSAQSFSEGYDILLTDNQGGETTILQYVASHFPINGKVDLVALNVEFNDKAESVSQEEVKTYDHVVLGGTFDRPHTGHKILLSWACMIANQSITVGVTDGPMNSRKTLCELIEPVQKRVSGVVQLIKDMKPSLIPNVVPIEDAFGPSTVDAKLECIIVSQETLKGGKAVNDQRNQKGLSTLDVEVIDLIEEPNHDPEDETKISSSTTRKRLLGTLLHEDKVKIYSQDKPFIIGLTGGIASGKSSVCRRLENLGAGIVDCDKLGHKAYCRGSRTLEKIVDAFGSEILDGNGEINRKVLGGIVFSDKEQLQRLNQIVWPAIKDLAKEEIQKFWDSGIKVVVLDAAVLIEAGWDDIAHEVWVVIVPKGEAVKRVIERNKLSEAEALQRIESQISNDDRVSRASVVLSTLWEPEVTQKQVEKAWKLLLQRRKL